MTTSTTPHIQTKLPAVGTTIFTVMSALAQETGAVNLGQGFPDFACDSKLIDCVSQAMQQGHNQYPPMTGIAPLRTAISDKVFSLHGRRYDATHEVTITAGATQGILTAVLAIVQTGDEVIVLEPCYDSYIPNIVLAGGLVVRVPLTPKTFSPDFERIAAAITPKTRAIIINSPHNPSAMVWSEADMRKLQELLAPTSILVISDEVYEHMVFDGQTHQSVARFAGLAARSFVISSFGKTFHVTGWKLGAVCAPSPLMVEFRKVHQFNVFTVNTPMQYGLAQYLQDPKPYTSLPDFYQRKRDFFRAGLARTKFNTLEVQAHGWMPSAGSYFQCVDISHISDRPDADFCQWLTREVGVAAIPLSAFYADGFDQRVIRFCFAKRDETLSLAIERLAKL